MISKQSSIASARRGSNRQASIGRVSRWGGLVFLLLSLTACNATATATPSPQPTARVVSPPPVAPTQPLLLPTPTTSSTTPSAGVTPLAVPDLSYPGQLTKLTITYSEVFGGAAFNDRDTQAVFMTTDPPDKVLSYYTTQFVKIGFPQPDRYQDGTNFVLASQTTGETVQVVVDSTDTILQQPNLLPNVQQQLKSGQTLVFAIYRQKTGIPRALLTPTKVAP